MPKGVCTNTGRTHLKKGHKLNLGRRRVEYINVICTICKKEFQFRKSAHRRFCSKKCSSKFTCNTKQWKEMMKKCMSGKNNHAWKGGKRKHTEGYTEIKVPREHPFCNSGGYILEHRYVMEKHLKRYLKLKERVHHLNGVRTDNRIENLILFPTDSEHQKFHQKIIHIT